jgi:putative ABC transport system permease protein
MFNYYLRLALRSLRRNVVLTALTIAAIGVGIGASMTMVTIFRAEASDPIPQESAQLYTPQIDNYGPGKNDNGLAEPDGRERFQDQLAYIDAMGLMNAHAAERQAAMFPVDLAVTPADPRLLPFSVQARATFADFFPMFAVPFRYGAAWSTADDTAHADVVVITRRLNDKVFGGVNSVGRTLHLDDHDYRVIGVLDRWEPIPRFYDLTQPYGLSEDVFVPLTRAIEDHMTISGRQDCPDDSPPLTGYDGQLQSECVWLQFWVELPTAASVAKYRAFLNDYAAEQRRSGRFHWPPRTRLRNMSEWLDYHHVVENDVKMLVLVSFSFLLVCLLNAMGLMLAKIMGRTADINVRRALGASRTAVFIQCLIEAGVIGLAGGLVGLALTSLGLRGLVLLFSGDVGRLAHLDLAEVGCAVALGVIAAMAAGLYPTWRATQVQPAWQLKTQ